jgi:hypothetical protein
VGVTPSSGVKFEEAHTPRPWTRHGRGHASARHAAARHATARHATARDTHATAVDTPVQDTPRQDTPRQDTPLQEAHTPRPWTRHCKTRRGKTRHGRGHATARHAAARHATARHATARGTYTARQGVAASCAHESCSPARKSCCKSDALPPYCHSDANRGVGGLTMAMVKPPNCLRSSSAAEIVTPHKK